jgi:pimeloyl-ACP methyl ester carboxylesterase
MTSPSGCLKASWVEKIDFGGLEIAVRKWGPETAPPIVMIHGTRDCSATFQFVVDHLQRDWHVIAPDLRGHGRSQWTANGYWLHEFLADLDTLMETILADQAVPMVGHSLGGNIASLYAGIRPGRLSHLISLDGFGPLVNAVPVDTAQQLRRYLEFNANERQHPPYPSIENMAERLRKANPRLDENQALFLAENSSTQDDNGIRRWAFDPRHRLAFPTVPTMEEWGRVWAGIRIPVLWLSSDHERPHAPNNSRDEMVRRAAMMPGSRHLVMRDTSHNLHHDAPALVAELIEGFVDDPNNARFLTSDNAYFLDTRSLR